MSVLIGWLSQPNVSAISRTCSEVAPFGDSRAIQRSTCSVDARESGLAAFAPGFHLHQVLDAACPNHLAPVCNQDRISRIGAPLLTLVLGA